MALGANDKVRERLEKCVPKNGSGDSEKQSNRARNLLDVAQNLLDVAQNTYGANFFMRSAKLSIYGVLFFSSRSSIYGANFFERIRR